MARPLPHLITGGGLTLFALMKIALGATFGWVYLLIAFILSFLSHFLWDTLNWGEDTLYHAWGESKPTKGLFLALELVAGGALVLLAIEYPWTLLGMALAMAWDLDHVLYQVSSRTGWFEWPRHYLHGGNKWLNAGYSTPWMRSEKALWVWAVVIVLGLVLIWR